jgi:DHA1 family 2-module integral membrane pump EmrD-like MFS transporter
MSASVKHPQQMLYMIIGFLMVGQLGETIYLPAMPEMVIVLQCSTGDIQWILSAYLLGFGLCQFIYGPISDYYGRRPVVLGSLIIYLVGSILCACAMNAQMLIWGALIAGVGIGSGGLMARSAIRDLFDGIPLQQALALVGVAIVFTPMAAPVLGAYFLQWFGWRFNFIMFVVSGVLFLLLAWYKFEETNPYCREFPLTISGSLQRYKKVLLHPVFMGNMLCGMMNIAAIMSYELVAPFLFQKQMGMSPVSYAWFALMPVAGFLAGSAATGQLARTYSAVQIGILGNISVLLACLTLFIPIWLNTYHLITILPPLITLMFGSGIIFSNTTAAALMPFKHESGVAGATIGGMQNIGAGVLTAIMSVLEIDTLLPLVWTLTIATLLGAACYLIGTFLAHQSEKLVHTA